MNPLLDEKIVLSMSRILPSVFEKTLGVVAKREAYGPSKNEGLCFEKCSAIDLIGDFNGTYFLGFDGYTKTCLLPYIAKSFHMSSFAEVTSSQVFLEFVNLICGNITNELNSAGFTLDISPPRVLDNKLVAVNLEEVRQYMIIYMVLDRERRKHLGRVYAIFTLNKFEADASKLIADLPPYIPDWRTDAARGDDA